MFCKQWRPNQTPRSAASELVCTVCQFPFRGLHTTMCQDGSRSLTQDKNHELDRTDVAIQAPLTRHFV